MQLGPEELKPLNKVRYLVGNEDIAKAIPYVKAKKTFDNEIIGFFNEVSKIIMKSPESRAYSDVVTFGFWIRKSSVLKLMERHEKRDGLWLGRGVAFHIAPSNVPVNFAYSLVSGLLCGNANIVRVPTKDFPQVGIITDAINKALETYEGLRSYILCVRYDHDKSVNDLFSSISDVRIVWGGNQTISEIRKSPMPPRAVEVAFSDRYSLAVIDSDFYIGIDDKEKIAEDFYNDTFLMDQNACTSPMTIVWMGNRIDEAKKVFWETEHAYAEKKYRYQSVQGVNKLTQCLLMAADTPGVRVEEHEDNLIIRVRISEITENLMDYRDNCGYFYEYDCTDICEILPLVNDKRCQTVSYIGKSEMISPLLDAGIKGIDRIVPMGKTMDFDLIWDGYDLPALLSRVVTIV